MHKPILLFKYDTPRYIVCSVRDWIHYFITPHTHTHTHTHTLPPLTHSIREILPKQVIQYFPVTNRYSHLTRHFPVLRWEPVELSWTWQVRFISHTFYTPTVSFSINTAIFALWMTLCVCVRKSNQLLPVRLFQGLKRTLLFVILDSVKFILILRHCSCKKKKNTILLQESFFHVIKMSSALCFTAAAERWLCHFCFLLLYNVLLLGCFLSQRKI